MPRFLLALVVLALGCQTPPPATPSAGPAAQGAPAGSREQKPGAPVRLDTARLPPGPGQIAVVPLVDDPAMRVLVRDGERVLADVTVAAAAGVPVPVAVDVPVGDDERLLAVRIELAGGHRVLAVRVPPGPGGQADRPDRTPRPDGVQLPARVGG